MNLRNHYQCLRWYLLATILFCITCTDVFAGEYPYQPERPLVEVLEKFGERYEVLFSYDSRSLKDIQVEFEFRTGEQLESAIGRLLAPTNLAYESFGEKYYVLYKKSREGRRDSRKISKHLQKIQQLEERGNLRLQQKRQGAYDQIGSVAVAASKIRPQFLVRGTVIDQSGQPLIGVNILVQGSDLGTVTDVDGRFTLDLTDGSAVLVFSYIGYETLEVQVEGRQELQITLQASTASLEEIVVVGYGSTRKSDLTGALTTLGGSDIANRQSLQVSDALQGTMAGVTVTRGGGDPGAGGTVRIRGVTSLNVNDPLVIVDGVPGLGLNDVNPNDIETITVLKDAASQAIYGARAAAGVILITTKRGQEGTLQLNYDYELGVSTPTVLPEFADARTYRILANERSRNDGGGNIFDVNENENYDQLNASDPDLFPNANWQDAILSRDNSRRHRHDLSASVGSDKVRTRASLSYVSEDGLYANRNFERYTFRVNNNLKLNRILEANIDAFYKRTSTLDPSQDGVIALARRYPGIYPTVRTDGEWGEGKDGENPLAQTVDGGTLEQRFNQLSGIIGLTLTPLEGLSIRANFSPTFDFNQYDEFTTPALIPRQGSTSEFWPQNPSDLEKRQTTVLNLTSQVTAGYNRALGQHKLGVLAGYEEIGTDWEEFRTTSRSLSVNLRSLTFGDPLLTNNTQFASQNALRSFFGRLTYDFKGKYLIQSNFRADASSRFAPGNRWGVFPSVSAGWVVSNESFNLPEVISFLKLRASYGEVGNERIGEGRTGGSEFFNYYPYLGLFERTNVIFYNGSSFVSGLGIRQDFLADEAIVWETTRTIDLGADLSLFDNRFSLSVDYYKKNTDDIILTLDIPNYLGFEDDTKTNVGSLEVSGLDLEAGYRNRIGELSYSVNLNVSGVRSQVTDVGGREDFTTEGGTKINIPGSEFNEWFGFQTQGIYQTREQVEQYGTNAAPGDVWIIDQLTVDTNGDGVPDARDNIINELDRVPLGASLPKLTYGGNVSMRYKGLDLALVFNGVGKHTLRYSGFQVQPFSETFGNIPATLLGNYWSPENSAEENESARYPRFSGRSENLNFAVSDFWLFNGSYFRLQNLILGYTLPPSLTDRARLNQLRFYVALRDFFTVERNFLDGWDPEATGSGYPIMKSVLLGVSVKL